MPLISKTSQHTDYNRTQPGAPETQPVPSPAPTSPPSTTTAISNGTPASPPPKTAISTPPAATSATTTSLWASGPSPSLTVSRTTTSSASRTAPTKPTGTKSSGPLRCSPLRSRLAGSFGRGSATGSRDMMIGGGAISLLLRWERFPRMQAAQLALTLAKRSFNLCRCMNGSFCGLLTFLLYKLQA